MDAARPILVVHSGAGDESLFTGGTLAVLSAAGSAITVVTCASDPSHDRATAEAMRALGVADHRVLGAPDARIAGAPARRYAASGVDSADTLTAADPAEIAADIATVIAVTGAGVVIGPPDDDQAAADAHLDRRVTSRAARRAAEVMGARYYPVVTDPWADAEEIDVASVIERKAAAVRAYRALFTVDGDTVVLDDGSRMPLGAVERFDTGERRARSATEWSELGIGGRVTTLIAALLLGAVVGALGTIAFQATLTVFELVLPAGVIASLLIVAGILVGLRMVTGTRFVAAAAAVGVLGVVAVLSQESPGGSILIPALPPSYFWIYGSAAIAFIVLAWPDLGRGHRRGVDERRVRIAEASNRKEHPQQ